MVRFCGDIFLTLHVALLIEPMIQILEDWSNFFGSCMPDSLFPMSEL